MDKEKLKKLVKGNKLKLDVKGVTDTSGCVFCKTWGCGLGCKKRCLSGNCSNDCALDACYGAGYGS